jgi:hypothetical protein
MEQEGKVSDKYTTEDMIAYVQRWKNCCASPYIDDESEADVQKCIDIERTIIARLRAADALCTVAEDLVCLTKQLMKETEEPYDEKAELAEIRKAIADYEGVA